MFQSARIKLTVWYVGIIMLISVLFSLVIFAGINNELRRFEHLHKLRIEREQKKLPATFFPRRMTNLDPEMIKETRNRLAFILLLVNLGILIVSGGAAYFLSGKTLLPLKEMVDEQNRFITDASHEFRTPLTSLRSEIEVNLRDKKLTLQKTKALLKSNLEEVINLQQLSDQLMELAQYQKKNNGLKFEKLNLIEIFNLALKKILPLADKKNITLRKKIINCQFFGNKQSLTELLIILLDNAIKYSKNNTKVTIISSKTKDEVIITIKDQGIGIDRKNLPHIFDRFYRADSARSKINASGYGLGLSIAKKIVELHHGSIKVRSRLNKGSVFTLYLPLKQTAHARQ